MFNRFFTKELKTAVTPAAQKRQYSSRFNTDYKTDMLGIFVSASVFAVGMTVMTAVKHSHLAHPKPKPKKIEKKEESQAPSPGMKAGK